MTLMQQQEPLVNLARDHHSQPSMFDTHLAHVEARLAREFGSVAGPGEIHRRVASAFAQLGEVRIRQFVPIIVERIVRADLRRLERSPASGPSALPGACQVRVSLGQGQDGTANRTADDSKELSVVLPPGPPKHATGSAGTR